MKSAEKLLKALRGGRIHRLRYRFKPGMGGHFDSDLFFLATQAKPALPDSGPVFRRLSISNICMCLASRTIRSNSPHSRISGQGPTAQSPSLTMNLCATPQTYPASQTRAATGQAAMGRMATARTETGRGATARAVTERG